MASISGKLLRLKFNDKYIKCQLDASVSLNNTFDEEADCKPEGTDLVSTSSYVTRILESQDTTVSTSYRLFLDALDGAALTQSDLIQLNIDGDVYGEVEFLTTPGQHNEPNNLVLTIPVVISSIGLEAPATGRASGTIEFLGNGKPTQSLLPVTT